MSEEGLTISKSATSVPPNKKNHVMCSLRTCMQIAHAEKLKSLENQGKTFECLEKDKASVHFFVDGKYTRFADWRFIHRARHNLLPLNANRRWAPQNTQNCRRCNYHLETLPHVIQHCRIHSDGMQQRHNALVNRLPDLSLYKKCARGFYLLS